VDAITSVLGYQILGSGLAILHFFSIAVYLSTYNMLNFKT